MARSGAAEQAAASERAPDGLDQSSAGLGLETFDLLAVRPLCIVWSVTALPFYLVTGPMLWPGGPGNEAREVLIDLPIEQTYKRPLGEL